MPHLGDFQFGIYLAGTAGELAQCPTSAPGWEAATLTPDVLQETR
ncbi:MAG TPA: hypothetical protein VFP61_13130 [Acidimicrobiales bacterium]|nr:hypothetical protein [Acidimicrobiales bacterium]